MQINISCLIKKPEKSFFKDFPDPNLMQNKAIIDGQRHDRPCFFALTDKKQEGLFWLIPISSKIEKYNGIYVKKMQRYGRCNTIYFAEVMGRKSAFLIQNMFPITENYISHIYIDPNTLNAVTISDNEAKKIIHNAHDVLKLHNRGINLIFPKIDIIREERIKQLQSKEQMEPSREKTPWNDYLIQLTRRQDMIKQKIKSQEITKEEIER